MREWSNHATLGYPVTFGDATASGTALAFLISRPYSFRTLGGSADVHFFKQIRSRIRIGGALSRRGDGPFAHPPRAIMEPQLAPRLRGGSQPPPQRRQLQPPFLAFTD